MNDHQQTVLVLQRLPLAPGQRLHIEDGPRRGDWEVVEVGDRKMTLRCPVSGAMVQWDRFCYLATSRLQAWPLPGDELGEK